MRVDKLIEFLSAYEGSMEVAINHPTGTIKECMDIKTSVWVGPVSGPVLWLFAGAEDEE